MDLGKLADAAEHNHAAYMGNHSITRHVDIDYRPINSKRGIVHPDGWRTVYPMEVRGDVMYALDDPRASFPKCYRLNRIMEVR